MYVCKPLDTKKFVVPGIRGSRPDPTVIEINGEYWAVSTLMK